MRHIQLCVAQGRVRFGYCDRLRAWLSVLREVRFDESYLFVFPFSYVCVSGSWNITSSLFTCVCSVFSCFVVAFDVAIRGFCEVLAVPTMPHFFAFLCRGFYDCSFSFLFLLLLSFSVLIRTELVFVAHVVGGICPDIGVEMMYVL